MDSLTRPQRKSPVPSQAIKKLKSSNNKLLFLQPQGKKRFLTFKNPSYNPSPVMSPKGQNLNIGQKQFLSQKPLKVRQNSESHLKLYDKLNKISNGAKESANSKVRISKTSQGQRKLTIQNLISPQHKVVMKKQQQKLSVGQKSTQNSNLLKDKELLKSGHHLRGNSYNGNNVGSIVSMSSVLSSRRNSRQNSRGQLQMLQEQNVVQGVCYKSKVGFIPGNVPKVNQDSYLIQNFFNKSLTQHFYAVADGHGMCGHDVSHFVKQRLPVILQGEAQLKENPIKSLRKSIMKVSEELTRQQFDVQFSGTTLVSILIQGQKLFCANVGDSRAILVRGSGIIPLNRDHKAELQDEAQRIYKNNGRIMAYQGIFSCQMKKGMTQVHQEFELKKQTSQDQL